MERIIINVDTRVATPSTLKAKRGDTTPVEVKFVQGDTGMELSNGDEEVQVSVKPKTALAGENLVFSESWSKTGSGQNTVYVLNPSWDTNQLDAYFSSQKEPLKAILGLEVRWKVEGDERRTQILTIELENNLNRDSDPTDANPDYPAASSIALKTRTAEWRYDITALTGNTTSSLDGIDTAGGAVAPNTLLFLNRATEKAYVLLGCTSATSSPSFIRPHDFNVSTNPYCWVLFL